MYSNSESAAPRFGVRLPAESWRLATVLEEVGFDSVWASEHVFFRIPTFDVVTVLSAMAAITTRIQLGSSVLLLALRRPAVAAKEFASLDRISEGRVTIGVGAGGDYPLEYEACGIPIKERGARLNEGIEILKALFAGEIVDYEGRFTRLPGVTLMPPPVQPGGPPIWVAGRSEAAMERAGRLGDGYLPYMFSAQQFRSGLATVREAAEKAGRDPAAITPAIFQNICLADTREEAKVVAAENLSHRYGRSFEESAERYVAVGNADDCRERLREFVDAGARHFVLVPVVREGANLQDSLVSIAGDVVQPLRSGV